MEKHGGLPKEEWKNMIENAIESLPTLSDCGRNGFDSLEMLYLEYGNMWLNENKEKMG